MTIELKQAAQQALDAFEAFGEADDFATLFTLTQKMNALSTAIQQAESDHARLPGVLKDHQIAAMVNSLRDIARQFHGHDSLRERIANVLVPALKAEAKTDELVQVFLVRDVASLLGASVPDVCDALAELGYEPRRSTNAAISPDEAIAVAKRINPAPGVPDDVVLVRGLVEHIERNTCTHEETHRSGAIWEVCDSCGARWADDEGGRPTFKWPPIVEKARAELAAAKAQKGQP